MRRMRFEGLSLVVTGSAWWYGLYQVPAPVILAVR